MILAMGERAHSAIPTPASFQRALANASDGDVIRLKGNVTVPCSDSDVLMINAAVTIDGTPVADAGDEAHAGAENSFITFRGCDLQLGDDVTFKNLKLMFNNGVNVNGVIYQAGHELTLDNVNTLVGPLQTDVRPIIYTGVKDDTGVIGEKAVLDVINPHAETRLHKIYVGSPEENSTIPVDINLVGTNIKVDEGIYLGSEDDTEQTGAVTIVSQSNFVNKVGAAPAGAAIGKRSVTFNKASLTDVQLSGIHDVTLADGAYVTLGNMGDVDIRGIVTVAAGTTLKIADNAVHVAGIAGDGTVMIGSNGSITAGDGGVSSDTDFQVYRSDMNWAPLLGHVYVTASGSQEPLTISLTPAHNDYEVARNDGGAWELRKVKPVEPGTGAETGGHESGDKPEPGAGEPGTGTEPNSGGIETSGHVDEAEHVNETDHSVPTPPVVTPDGAPAGSGASHTPSNADGKKNVGDDKGGATDEINRGSGAEKQAGKESQSRQGALPNTGASVGAAIALAPALALAGASLCYRRRRVFVEG